VVVVDDHPVVRAGLRALLDGSTQLSVVGEAADAISGEQVTADTRPHVVLMDLNLGPGADGIAGIGMLNRLPDPPRVVVLTTYDTDADILRAVEAGAAGYLLKDCSQAELTSAIRAAARGETVLTPSVATRLVNRMRAPQVEALSPREVQVLELVAVGHTNAEIGRELHISEATVKTHLLRSFSKLDVSDRTAAVTAARNRGVLS